MSITFPSCIDRLTRYDNPRHAATLFTAGQLREASALHARRGLISLIATAACINLSCYLAYFSIPMAVTSLTLSCIVYCVGVAGEFRRSHHLDAAIRQAYFNRPAS